MDPLDPPMDPQVALRVDLMDPLVALQVLPMALQDPLGPLRDPRMTRMVTGTLTGEGHSKAMVTLVIREAEAEASLQAIAQLTLWGETKRMRLVGG